jgi:hypothetical protein
VSGGGGDNGGEVEKEERGSVREIHTRTHSLSLTHMPRNEGTGGAKDEFGKDVSAGEKVFSSALTTPGRRSDTFLGLRSSLGGEGLPGASECVGREGGEGGGLVARLFEGAIKRNTECLQVHFEK